MDRRSATTKRYKAEAKRVGLVLLGSAESTNYRLYRFKKCGHEQEILPNGVRNKSFHCAQCKQQQYRYEAQSAGLILVSASKKQGYSNYKFKQCGHETPLRLAHVRAGSINCTECFKLKLKDEAKAAGLSLLGAGRNANYRLYKFNNCGHMLQISPSSVRRESFRCNECLNEKWHKEAALAGLKIIGPGKNHAYRRYRFKDCSHEKEITLDSVKKRIFQCDPCFQEKLKQEAKSRNLMILGPAGKPALRSYKFINCGHEQDIATSSVRSNSFRCITCLELKFINEAKAAGLSLLGAGRNANYRLYKFNNCGHEKELKLDHVREQKNFKCSKCFEKKLENEAKVWDMEILGPAKHPAYRNYRFTGCGHEQPIQTRSVRNGSFLCNSCENTSRDHPSLIYLLEIKFEQTSWLKLGYSKDIDTRIKQYGLPENAKIQKLLVKKLPTGREAHALEASLHKEYRRRRMATKEMEQFHTRSGASECYPMKIKKILIDALKIVEKNESQQLA